MIKLEPRCRKNVVNGISIDPNPNWNFNDLISELNSLESKLCNNVSNSPINPKPFTKSPAREIPRYRKEKNEEPKKGFIMRVDDDLFGESDGEDEIEGRSLVPASRFNCNDIYLSESDDSDNEEMQQQVTVMEKISVVEGAFLELTHEHELGIKEEIRNQVAALEMQLVAEKEKSSSALAQVEKNTDARRQMDRRVDLHYQRKIAEALDNHLTSIQRDHEHIFQIEERKIRDDAALEEAKRKEKALQEERLRQQKAKEDEVKREAKRAEEERKAAHEAERVAKEAADKLAKENSAKEAVTARSTTAAAGAPKEVKSAGNLIKATDNALKLERRRLQTYKELEDMNQSIISASNMDLRPKDREMARLIRQISGSMNSVRSKASQLMKIFSEPAFPQSVTVALFAKKVISYYENPNTNLNSSAFACGHVIVHVSAQVPAVIDCLLAEFHKACIYTVPKHYMYSKAAFETEDSYYKVIGFREEEGKIETTDRYLERLSCLMKLYGALVQTEVQGVPNKHGLEEGWAWLARFLNAIPCTRYTVVALEAFLGMAGYALHSKYQSQFRKILNAIATEFVPELRQDPKASSVASKLEAYIESKKYLQEPEGRQLQYSLSHDLVPDTNYSQEQYKYTPNRNFIYQR